MADQPLKMTMHQHHRRAQDQHSTAQRPALAGAALLGVAVALLAMLGISLRSASGLSPLWPAAPVFLGLLLRFPTLAQGWSWLTGLAGWTVAESLLGTPWLSAFGTALGHVLCIGLAYLTFSRTSPSSRELATPQAVLHMLLTCLVAAVAHSLWSAQTASSGTAGLAARNMLHWFVCDLVNYLAFLPIVLTLPDMAVQPQRWAATLRERAKGLRQPLPAIALAVSVAVAFALQGKGAAILTIPALLWCSISYSLFTSALLSAALGMGFFLDLTLGAASLPLSRALSQGQQGQLLADQGGLAVLMLAALTVASAMAAQREMAKRMRLMADFDQLTRLPVRNAFFQWGHKLLQHRYLQRLPVSVMAFDIDQLQHINDTYGHDAGDKVLTAFARHLQSSLRRQDCLGRLGGEEFGVILCNQTEQDAYQVIERICLRFALLPIALSHGETVHCTVCAGGVTTARAPLSLGPLLNQADIALRRAKRKGKSQWDLQVYQPPAPETPPAGGASTAPARPSRAAAAAASLPS